MTPAPRQPTWPTFLIGASVIGILIYFVAVRFHTFPPWAVFLAVSVLTVVIMLSGIYTATLARIHENALRRASR